MTKAADHHPSVLPRGLPVVLTVHSAQMYGVANSALRNACVLQELGCTVTAVLCEEGPLQQALAARGIPCEVSPILHYGLRRNWRRADVISILYRVISSRLRFMRLVFRTLRNLKNPILHAHSIHSVYAVIAAKLAGARVAWHIHEERGMGWHGLLQKCLLTVFADRVVFVSAAIGNQFRLAGEKVATVHNFIEMSALLPRSDLSPATPCIAFVGMLLPNKGPLEFIEVCRRLYSRSMAFRAIMAGGGRVEYVAALRKAVADAGLGEIISLAGFVENMEEVYRKVDIVVSTSRTEALPRVVMEAMAYGLPVVASDVGGSGELVVHKETGFLFAPDNLDSAVNAVEALIRDNALRSRMGVAGRRRVESLFSRSAYKERMEGVYTSLGVS